MLWAFISFLLWNIGTTWWVANATLAGGIFAFTINALLMTLVFGTWSLLDRKLASKYSFWLLIPIWLLFEFAHHRWDLSWPWLTLGNYFSVRSGWIQWYEWTGTLGGSAWILSLNLLIFKLLLQFKENKNIKGHVISLVTVLIFPLIISQILLSLDNISITTPQKLKALVLQPNIDPYTEKFAASASNEAFTDSLLHLAKTRVGSHTDLLLGPETTLPLSFIEDKLSTFSFGQKLQKQIDEWPNTNILIGAATVRIFDAKKSVASTPIPNDTRWYESYNTSMLLTKNRAPQFAHKSKLVPGVELVPFSAYLPFLSALAIENGGTSGTLGIENEPKTMRISLPSKEGKTVLLAPIICYESIYGDFVRQQVNKGAQALCILTNDGWWGNTPGYKQHFSFACLRAIETRRWVLRSANTGTSGSIDPSGKITKKTSYWTKTAFSQTIQLRTDQTFYTKYGDWPAGISISWILLVMGLVFRKKSRQSSTLKS